MVISSKVILIAMKKPLVTAEKYIRYKIANGHLKDYKAPEVILICYQQSSFKYLMQLYTHLQPCTNFTELYFINEKIAVMANWGFGAGPLATKLEQFIVLGTKTFIAVGTAGTLDSHQVGDFIVSPSALAEDGVAVHYLPQGQTEVKASEELLEKWNKFSSKFAPFKPASSWSFPAIFRESAEDIIRVKNRGFHVVEMESATLYAIGQEKNVKTLSLYVISDILSEDHWEPHIKEPIVKKKLHLLIDWAIAFSNSLFH